jgi:hypothetical protein
MKAEGLLLLTALTDHNLAGVSRLLTGEEPDSKPQKPALSADTRLVLFMYNRESRGSWCQVKQMITQIITADTHYGAQAAVTFLVVGLKFFRARVGSGSFSLYDSGSSKSSDLSGEEATISIDQPLTGEVKKFAREREIFHQEIDIKVAEDYGTIRQEIDYWLHLSRVSTETIAELLAYREQREAGPDRRRAGSRFSKHDKLAAELALRAYLSRRSSGALALLRQQLPVLKQHFLGKGSDLRNIFLRHVYRVCPVAIDRTAAIDQWVRFETGRMSSAFRS